MYDAGASGAVIPSPKITRRARACMSMFTLGLLLCGFVRAQTTAPLPNYQLLNSIASCPTVTCVTEKQNDMDSKVEKTVLYTTWLILDPSSQTASIGLLENMPATRDELAAFMTLTDWHEGAANSDDDGRRLEAVYKNWPRLLSVAVRQFPGFLPTYIRYGRLAVNDIHAGYTSFERTVCQTDPKRFVAAFRSLGPDEQRFIRKRVFNPYTCQPILFSKAESAR